MKTTIIGIDMTFLDCIIVGAIITFTIGSIYYFIKFIIEISKIYKL